MVLVDIVTICVLLCVYFYLFFFTLDFIALNVISAMTSTVART